MSSLAGYDPLRDSEGFHFDEAAANFNVDFIQTHCSHVKGELAGQPMILSPWEKDVVRAIFGWLDKKGLRRYREAFIYVPRKQGKTTLIACLTNCMGFCDGEKGGEIFSAAADRDQASICFNIAKQMVVQNPYLSRRAEIFTKSIQYKNTGTFYRSISSDANTKHGYNPSLVLVDEVHAMPNADLINALKTGMGARSQPLLIYITTADYERPSICNELLDYALRVREGAIKDASFLPVLFMASTADDWTSEETWKKANPNYGISVKPEFLKQECERAKNSARYENVFKQLYLNVKTEQQSRWLQMEAWRACGDGETDPVIWRQNKIAAMRGRRCWGGLDLGSTSDLTAFVLLFNEHDRLICLCWFWMPELGLAKKDFRFRELYQTWINQGFIIQTDGEICDYDKVRADIVDLMGQFEIVDVAVDRLFQGAETSERLRREGLDILGFPQSFMGMTAPSKAFEEAVIGGRLSHGNNPVLTWMAANVGVKADQQGNIKPVKMEGPLKIDGIVAAVMAMARSLVDPSRESFWEAEGGVAFL